jgi:hypothetical protein
MTSRIILIAVILIALGVCAGWAFQKANRKPTPKPAVKVVSFKTDVAPVFKTYCLPCHTEDQMNPSELYLDSYANIMAGGKHGKCVVAGNPDSSLMIRKISMTPPIGDPMPMKRKTPFPADTLKILSEWIKQGAKNN